MTDEYSDRQVVGPNWSTETLRQLFATSHQDLKDAIATRLAEMEKRYEQKIADNERRYADKFEAIEKAAIARTVASDSALHAALMSAEKAVDKAESQQRAHNIQQNEWRATINDLTSTVAERARHESESMVEALSKRAEVALKGAYDKIDDVKSRIDKLEGRATGSTSMYTFIIAGIAAAVSAAGILVSWNNSNQSQATGMLLRQHLETDPVKPQMSFPQK